MPAHKVNDDDGECDQDDSGHGKRRDQNHHNRCTNACEFLLQYRTHDAKYNHG